MSSKDSFGRKYKKPTVVEDLCEIYFVDSKWDSTVPGMFYDRIKEEYPEKKELHPLTIALIIC